MSRSVRTGLPPSPAVAENPRRLPRAEDTMVRMLRARVIMPAASTPPARHRVAHFGSKEIKDPRERFPQRADPEPAEHECRKPAAPLARNQHLGARGALRVGERRVLLDDQRAAQRHHHEDAQNPARERQHHDLQVAEVVGTVGHEEDQRRDRKDHTARDRFTGRPDRLDDVVFENGGAAEPLQHRNRQDGDWNGGANRQSGAQPQVHGGGAEEQAEENAEHDRLGGEFRRRLRRRHVRAPLSHGARW